MKKNKAGARMRDKNEGNSREKRRERSQGNNGVEEMEMIKAMTENYGNPMI